MNATALDTDAIREVHRRFITGVTVVTVDDAGTPRGLAVNAFCSVSLEPPLVMVCVQQTSSTYPSLFRTDHLAVNILATTQLDAAGVFASKEPDKFSKVAWSPGPHGSPMLDGACAAVEVNISERLQASTHTVFIGRIVEARHRDVAPLMYRAGQFYDPEQLEPVVLQPRTDTTAHSTGAAT